MEMKRIAGIALSAGLVVSGASMAQLAPPQWRQPGVDSTHVVGTAVRVMPEYPQMPVPVDENNPAPVTTPPQSIPELLRAFDGVILAMPDNDSKGAHGQRRIVISSVKAQVQSTVSWTWYDVCVLTEANPTCRHGNQGFHLSPEGVFSILMGCAPGEMGDAGGAAEFKWADFVAFGGLAAAPKMWSLQRSSLWSNCYASSGSND